MTTATEIITAGIHDASTDTLRTWLIANRMLISEFDPHVERTQLERCQQHIRDIKAELASRAGK